MTLPTSIAARPELELAHHRIHEGNLFHVNAINTNLQIINPKYFLFISPPQDPVLKDTTKVHLIFKVTANPGILLEFFEDSVVTDNGTAVPIINHNRNSITIPLGRVFENPTVTSDGTRIYVELIGTTTTGGASTTFDRNEDEYILKIQTNYLLKITPLIDGISTTTIFDGYDARPNSPV